MKKVYYDMETTSLDTERAEILQITFLLVEGSTIIKTVSSKIKITPEYGEHDKATLTFNKIYHKGDLRQHNKEAQYWEVFWKQFRVYYDAFTSNLKTKDRRPVLTGWNNTAYDGVILQRHIPEDINQLFFYRQRDIMQYFQLLEERKFFNSLSLSAMHKKLFGTIKNFHDSTNDCLAVKDLDEWLGENISIQARGEHKRENEM